MAFKPVLPLGSSSNPDYRHDCREAAELEFKQLARVWRYSIITGERALRDLAFRDMMAVPIFSIEALGVKVDAMRGECAEGMKIDRSMTCREIVKLDVLRVASGMPCG